MGSQKRPNRRTPRTYYLGYCISVAAIFRLTWGFHCYFSIFHLNLNKIMPSLRLAEKAIGISLSSLHYNYSTICNADKKSMKWFRWALRYSMIFIEFLEKMWKVIHVNINYNIANFIDFSTTILCKIAIYVRCVYLLLRMIK